MRYDRAMELRELLRRVGRRLSLSDQVAACFTDHCDPKRIHYSLRKLIAQRIVSHLRGGLAPDQDPAADRLRLCS